jgi:TRAP-type C4-dicarboxylate transport system substrate-binding protein
MKKSIVDRHLKKIVGVRFPDELRTELKKVALEYKLKMNDIVVEGTREIIKQIKKKDKLI